MLYNTFVAAERVAIDYAKRDLEPWYVINTGDGYQVITDTDRKMWYLNERVLYIADPIWL